MSFVESRDVPLDEIDVGDVIVIDRSVGGRGAHLWTVVEKGARDPRIDGETNPLFRMREGYDQATVENPERLAIGDILPRLKTRASHSVVAEQVNPEG